MKLFYMILAILGLILPYTQFIGWIMQHGLDISLLIQEINASKLSLFAWLDVIISAIVLITFICYEGKKTKIENLWIPIAGTLCVGVSFGLPLFLYMREMAKQRGDDL